VAHVQRRGQAKFSFLGVKLEARKADRKEGRRSKQRRRRPNLRWQVKFHLFMPTYNMVSLLLWFPPE